jgi:hypothetical protein
MKREEAAAIGAVPITGPTSGHDALRQRTLVPPEFAHAHPPASLDAVARLAVEGVRPLGVVVLNPRTGERVAL